MTVSTCSTVAGSNPISDEECSAINKSCNQIVLVSSRLIDLDHQRFCVAQAGERVGKEYDSVEQKRRSPDQYAKKDGRKAGR